jgi:CRP-like cAMP-binding protein
VSVSDGSPNSSQCHPVDGRHRPMPYTVGTLGAQSAPLTAIAESPLLAALPLAEQARLRPELEVISLALGDVVYESGEHLEYVYFPTSCVASLVYTTASGVTAEMGLVGNEGVVGIAIFMGGKTVPNRAVVLIAGGALRMKASVAHREFERGGPFQHVLLHYTQAFFTQISQTAVCSRLHFVEQRLCRWILLCHDRLQSDELQMTQESISHMLSARRQSVTVAAGHLQDAGLIQYARGHIKILDRAGLERAVCECYHVVKTECDRLMGFRGACI